MSEKMVYGIDDKPNLLVAIPLGLQHVLTLFGATTLVPLLLGRSIFGAGNEVEIARFVSHIYLGMGIATLFQIYIGSRLPIVQGSSFAFITPILAVSSVVIQGGGSSAEVMQTIAGALIVGGLIEAFIGFSNLIGKVKRFITPVVIGPTIMLIGFSLFDVAVNANAAQYWPISLLVVAGVFYFSLISKTKMKLFPVLISLVLVYLLCLGLSYFGVVTSSHPIYVDFSGALESEQYVTVPSFFPYGLPRFSLSAIFALFAAFLASMVESIGDYHSVAYAAGASAPDEKQISRGIGSEGLGCFINGLIGGVGTTSYTENIGLIKITGVASRYVVMIGALLLIGLSFFTPIGLLIASIPNPVIGGAYLALFGVIGAIGIEVLTRCDMSSQRNIMIVGFSFLIGLGVGKWMGGISGAGFSGFYQSNPCLLGKTEIAEICWDVIGAVFSTPMAVGAISALFLDNLIPGTCEERGLE